MPDATITLSSGNDPERFLRRLERLSAVVAEDDEVVIVAPRPSGAMRQVLALIEGDVTVLTPDEEVGRAGALELAAGAASGDVMIALGPFCAPEPGFAVPLVAAARGTGALVAPLIETPAGDVAGCRRLADGSLLPIAAGSDEAPDALAFDCIAAEPRLFARGLPPFAAREGFAENQLAQAAERLAIAVGSRVRREAEGPGVSVILCTRDRVDEVEGCLAALLAHGLPPAAAEVVIVDSGSSPGAAAGLAELADRHDDRVRLVAAGRPGLSLARQVGADAARLPIAAYLDDDARPGPGWLESVRESFLDPAVAVAGGPIVGLWEGPAPSSEVLPARLEGYVGVLGRDDGDHAITGGDGPWGGNYWIRRSVLDRLGGFDLRLGWSEEARIGGEEANVSRRVDELGLGIRWWATGGAVGHRVGSARIAPASLLARGFSGGVELVCAEQAVRTVPEAQLRAWLSHAATRLHAAGLLNGPASVDGLMAAIALRGAPLLDRFDDAYALGMLSAGAAALGFDELDLGGTAVRVSAANARGHVAPPLAEAGR